MRARTLLWSLLASTLIAAPSVALAQTPIVLEATIPETTPRYFAVPFTVPDGVREIEVRHDDLSAANILDWGLRDPARFRGWGGGNTEPAIVSERAASRSYIPGPIPAGQWSVMIGLAKVIERPARYRIEIILRSAPTLADQPERRPYAATAALNTGARWYAGDFHVHSRESGDASPSIDQIATFARGRGLDFIELSEHNVVTSSDFIVDAQARHPGLLLVPGTEFTTYGGHANAIGATQWVDFTASTGPMTSARAAVESIQAQGALFAINHPVLDLGDTCIGCVWSLDVAPERIAAVEIQNGRFSVTGALFYRPAIQFWEGLSSRGLHVAPIGGSDDHSAGTAMGMFDSPIGGPTTMVFARELSVAAIVEGVRAGRTVVKLQGPDDPMVDLRAGSLMIGDTIRDPSATLRATVTGGTGATLRFLRNGSAAREVQVTSDPFEATLAITAGSAAIDDRWRCDLIVASKPRVVTGHLWIAAQPPTDSAGFDASSASDAPAEPTADAASDAAMTSPSQAGCRCGVAARSRTVAPSVTVALLLAPLVTARRRTRAARA
ncbi:MAG: CehA/McbA family metallohydrolase [Polyangiales bacterium]